ncbi:MAK10-like protein [Tanacetum coccineum]
MPSRSSVLKDSISRHCFRCWLHRMIDDELVLHIFVVVEEMCIIVIVEELLKTVDGTEGKIQRLMIVLSIECVIDRAASGKLRNKNVDESWKIIENLALYDHEGWNDTKVFAKPVKAISTPQGTTFEARVRDYMAAHIERMERFESVIFKQRKEINGRMTKMFRLLKELTTSRAPEKVLVREEAKSLVTKSVNSISLIKEEEEKNDMYDVAPGDDSKETDRPDMEVLVKEHGINEKLIEGLVDNNRFNDSLLGARAGKKKGKTYDMLPRGPIYETILKKKITKKEDIGGYFEIPCSIGGLKHVNALVDQGSDVNVMPYFTYMKLTNERPTKTEIRLSLASHSYIYPLGIAEDVLVEIAEHVYPMDFVILDIKEDEKSPFILGTPFLTTAKAMIKFDKGTITLRFGKNKISFHRIPESPGTIERGVKNDIEPIATTVTVNRLVIEWEERIRLHQEREIEFD